MKKLKFETKPHKDVMVKSYRLKVFESDPYYHVEVTKDNKYFDDHLLMNDEKEFEDLKLKYEKM